jgi:hypothetical protein
MSSIEWGLLWARTKARFKPVQKKLNLDHNLGRALHRIVRAMHDGECPRCHKLQAADTVWTTRPVYKPNSRLGFEKIMFCRFCEFTITEEESEAVIREFGPYMEQNLQIFETWRANRHTETGS